MSPLVHTKIVATLGPSSDTKDKIKALAEAGVTMFRLNSSHGDEAQHLRNLNLVREIERELERPLPILLDLQGPKIRVGRLREPIELVAGSVVALSHQTEASRGGVIPVDYEGIAEDVAPGAQILLDDGKLILEAVEVEGGVIRAKVVTGGTLKERKGMNIPGSTGSLHVLTERDRGFVRFAVEHEVDYLGLSFVRDARDVMELRDLIEDLGGRPRIISKIEKPQAVRNIDEIIRRSSGIMVARGDLGVEISPERVPVVQKEIIRKANAQRKAVIVATQMLESMIEQPLPTRAEASDVANAIMDGADAVMLSGETAAGKYPVQSVQMMRSIAQSVEASKLMRRNHYPKALLAAARDDSAAICSAVVEMVAKIEVKAIVALTASGYTATMLSKAKPSVPIIAYCPYLRNRRQIALFRGVFPVQMDADLNVRRETLKRIDVFLIARHGLEPKDRVVLTGAIPHLLVGATNFIKIHEIGSVG